MLGRGSDDFDIGGGAKLAGMGAISVRIPVSVFRISADVSAGPASLSRGFPLASAGEDIPPETRTRPDP